MNSKGLSQSAPLLPGGGESASWRSSGRLRVGKVCVYARAALQCDEFVWADLLPRVVSSPTSGAAFNMSRWPLAPGQRGAFIVAQRLVEEGAVKAQAPSLGAFKPGLIGTIPGLLLSHLPPARSPHE